MNQKSPPQEEINEEMKKLVIARIDANLPSNLRLSIGAKETLSKGEMINHVRVGDEQGRQIIEMHLNFMRALTSGDFVKQLNSV